ncbi:MAG: tetratricopeptide repeat protein, partial [Planctomycetota bacterium]
EKASLLVEAWTEMGKGRLDEALTLTNRYLETDTDNPGAWRLRGRLYRLMNQPRKAVDDLQRSKGLQDDPAVRMELATVYNELNQVTAAIGELVSGLEDPQAPVQIRLTLESLYQRNGRTRDLDKLYNSTLEKYPQSAFWYYRAGLYYLKQKDFSKAQDLLKKSLDLSLKSGQPNSAALQYYLESLYQSEQYDKTITLASGYVDGPFAYISYGYIAQVQIRLNQSEQAAESFYKALDKAGTNDSALEGVMKIMLSTVGEEMVTAWINNKLAADSTSLPAHLLASSLAQMNGSYNKAIDEIDQCIENVGPDSPKWLAYNFKKVNLLILAYAKTVDQDYLGRATDLLTQILELQPNNPSLLNNLAYLLVDNDQQLEDALQYARRAHLQDPGNLIYLDTYAYAQCKTGQYKQAEENLIRAIQIYEVSGQPTPWEVYKHFGMAKEGLGKTKEAIEMYQKALDASDQIPEKERQQLQQAIQRLQQSL